MGLDSLFLRKWKESIQRMQRTWSCYGQASPLEATSTGFPEGDPLSVVALLTISNLWVLRIQRHELVARLFSFADNWSWHSSNGREHKVTFEETVAVTKATQMRIDWNKSWMWATATQQADQIRAALTPHAGHATVKQLNAAMDLGCVMTYQDTPRHGKLKTRIAQVLDRLTCLQRLPGFLTQKIHLLSMRVFTQS